VISLAGPDGAERVGGSREESGISSAGATGSALRRSGVRTESFPAGESDTVPPRLLEGRDAEYPLGAVQEGVTGTVELKVVVDNEGFVERAVVVRSSGDARLDAAAIRSVMTWRYRPARRGGWPVPGTDLATVEFFRDRGR
jgi:TonB family protein